MGECGWHRINNNNPVAAPQDPVIKCDIIRLLLSSGRRRSVRIIITNMCIEELLNYVIIGEEGLLPVSVGAR